MTIYRGLSGVNRTIKEQWRGLSGVNRTIKEQWRGLSGVNRKVYNPSIVMLYDLGDECTSVTGGWTEILVNSPAMISHSLTKNATNMVLALNTNAIYTLNSASTVNAINWTNYTTVKMLVDISNPSGKTEGFKLGTAPDAADIVATSTSATTATDLVLTMNVSAVNTSYKLHIYNYSNKNAVGAMQITIKKVWAEI